MKLGKFDPHHEKQKHCKLITVSIQINTSIIEILDKLKDIKG